MLPRTLEPHLFAKGAPLSTLSSLELISLGWDDRFAAELAACTTRPSTTPARVVRVDRGAVDLFTESGAVRAPVTPETDDLTVGDWVALAGDAIVAVLPRRTVIQRAAADGESRPQSLVANIDAVLVAVPAVPRPRLNAVERLVALAWDSGAEPVIVVTKVDLAPNPDALVAEAATAAPGCEVIAVSAWSGEGMASVAAHDRPARSLCLVGRSGAGKSTLANALLGHQHMAVTDVRRDGKGRHTTTHRELVLLPGGGVLIDTPGLRGVGVWLAEDGIAQTFPEIDELAGQCRFGDCRHEVEPGCAVLAAIEAGTLPQRRLDSWRKLGREAEWIAARHDARLRKQRQLAWRAVSAEVKRSGRIRP